MIVVIILICIDIALGLLNGFLKKEITSARSFIGMFKKVSIIGVTYAVKITEQYTHEDILDIVIYFFVITEIISIIENCEKLGVPMPDFLKKFFNNKGGD